MITKEAIEAARQIVEPNVVTGDIDDDTAAFNTGGLIGDIAAALSTLPIAVEGKVKALEWRNGYRDWQVKIQTASSGPFYQVRELDGVVWLDADNTQTIYPSVDAAKAAAQSDYETRILSALISSPGTVPEGWQLVPIEPTDEMLKAGNEWSGLSSQTWDDMLAAAPIPPSSPGKDGGQEVEAVAKRIYEAMRLAAHAHDPERTTPEWVERGNSLMQEEARRIHGKIP